MAFNSISRVRSYLESIPKFQSSGKSAANFDLDHFRKFSDALDNPQHSFPAIHVAGTNGKGSTCQILASVYQHAGYRVGIYTSPHMLSFSERFKINGIEISDTKLVEFFDRFEPLIKSFRLSYFELSTAIAFWYFADQQVDLAIIEVGLGGRLDATNIIVPEISVITNISLDHTDILGETIKEIALEKAGIIKPGVPVVLGNVNAEAKGVIKNAAKEKKSVVYETGHLRPEYIQDRYVLHPEHGNESFKSGLFTPVQAFNIAVAWQVHEILRGKFPVAREQFRKGVAEVRSIYPGLGRFEKLTDDYEWYFDGAHNLDAVQAMKGMVQTIRPIEESVLVLSMMEDKVNKQLLNEFSEFKKIFYHELNTQRAARYNNIKQLLPAVRLFPATEKQQRLIFKEFETELVIFAGSFYFYATVRDWLASIANNC